MGLRLSPLCVDARPEHRLIDSMPLLPPVMNTLFPLRTGLRMPDFSSSAITPVVGQGSPPLETPA